MLEDSGGRTPLISINYTVRKASPSEKLPIARTLAYAFEEDFSGLTKDMERIAKALENGIDTDRFVVAETGGGIIGITGCADCLGRAVTVTKKEIRKHLGLIRGSIAYMVLYEEAFAPLDFPPTTAMIDYVGVLKAARGNGIAKALLEKTVELNPQYTKFVLNVKDNNDGAIRVYERFGFVEYERIPYKWAKQAGFNAKVWMRYEPEKGER